MWFVYICGASSVGDAPFFRSFTLFLISEVLLRMISSMSDVSLARNNCEICSQKSDIAFSVTLFGVPFSNSLKYLSDCILA